ncbi:MAG: ABC transporter substrate-binding protein [Solirubrobacteraceae bacterium]
MRRWCAVALLLAGLAGCGGDDDDEPSGGGGPTAIKVQETAGVPSAFVGFGIDQGIFERHGLEVDLEATQGGAATLPALVSGDIQVGGSNVVSLLIASTQGLPVQVIAPGTSAQDEGEDFGALLAGADSGITDAQGFEGKTVAVNTLDNIAEVVVKAALEEEGADPSKVKLTEVGFPEMAPALEGGDVDGAFSIEPFVTTTVEQGAEVINYSYVATEPGMQVGAYAVSREFAEESPEAVEAFKAAVADTAQLVAEDEDAFRAFLAETAEIEPALAERIVLPQWNEELDVESLESTAELMRKYGLVDEEVDVQGLVG